MKSQRFYIPEARKKYPFQAEPPRIGHYREYPSGPVPGVRLVEKQRKNGKRKIWGAQTPHHFRPLANSSNPVFRAAPQLIERLKQAIHLQSNYFA